MQVWFGFEVWLEFKMFENGWLDQSGKRALSIGHVSFLEGKVWTARSCFKSKFIRITKTFIVIRDSSSYEFKVYSNPFIHDSSKCYPIQFNFIQVYQCLTRQFDAFMASSIFTIIPLKFKFQYFVIKTSSIDFIT